MSARRKAEGPRIGAFFLKLRQGVYQIAYYDERARQTRCISTGTRSLKEAEIKLAEHALRKSKPEERDDVLLADALSFYWLERGQNLASWETQKTAMRYALEVWGNPMVSELTLARQKEYIKYFRDRGLGDATILRHLVCIWTAMNYYQEEGRLKVVPARISNDKWNPDLPKRKRLLTLGELAALLNTASRLEHRWRFLILSLATGARPGALMELRQDQIDLEHNVIHLNPEGRAQTKKRRPSLPMCHTLRNWVESWVTNVPANGHSAIVTYNGQRITSDTYFDKLAEESGVNCCRYDIRHFVVTWLVRRGVPIDEREIFVGHRLPGSSTTEGYVHFDPSYLAKAAAAIEQLFQELAPLVTARDLLRNDTLEEQPVPHNVVSEVDEILSRLRIGA